MYTSHEPYMWPSSRELSQSAAETVRVNEALNEGGYLRPVWLDRFANWWAEAVSALRIGEAVDPTPRPRGCSR